MSSIEKENTYTSTNTYSTLNTLGPKTKNVWIVFHGIGYLSRYFINFFDTLSADENYIIAPQAPSKYYLKNQYKHVGASWLTKEKTELEIENVLNSIDSVCEKEGIPNSLNLIVFGFSQGVSIAARWVAKRKIKCSQLVFYAGGLPNELKPTDFNFLQENNTEVKVIIGDKDEYLTADRMLTENKRIDILFKGKAQTIKFEGGHEVKKEIVLSLIQ
ncbi:esterase [Aurantibacter crassamenti]|uniref:alpha/beta hydrolase n=1 Tax=Aurantibacter crassamenti TaxID=1837375 RepID=UPI0019392A16|nr:esterase [Aurantibacter crassamenti]MBM1107426.1 esterase [Aurantibacter crassamenti]